MEKRLTIVLTRKHGLDVVAAANIREFEALGPQAAQQALQRAYAMGSGRFRLIVCLQI